MLFLRYNDGNSSQWVQLNALPNGAGYMPLQGVTDGSNAPAGQIGEVLSINQTAGQALTNNAAGNITSLALAAGDWDVAGEAWFVGITTATSVLAAIGPTSGVFPVGSLLNASRTQFIGSITGNCALALRPCRVSLSAPATYYLIGQSAFTAGACTATGNIIARRAR